MKRTLLVLSLALLGCADLTGPHGQLDGIKPYDNQPFFAQHWARLESCSGLKGDLSRVHFYTVTKITVDGDDNYRGYWRRSDNSIFILDEIVGNTIVLEHEEMHALMQGGADHPHWYFRDGPCGDLMQ